MFILKFNYFVIFYYYRSIYTLLCFKYFTYFHHGQKNITMSSAAETRHAAKPRPYIAAKPLYPCCSTGISTICLTNLSLKSRGPDNIYICCFIKKKNLSLKSIKFSSNKHCVWAMQWEITDPLWSFLSYAHIYHLECIHPFLYYALSYPCFYFHHYTKYASFFVQK